MWASCTHAHIHSHIMHTCAHTCTHMHAHAHLSGLKNPGERWLRVCQWGLQREDPILCLGGRTRLVPKIVGEKRKLPRGLY